LYCQSNMCFIYVTTSADITVADTGKEGQQLAGTLRRDVTTRLLVKDDGVGFKR
jgi:hypothetical protein